MPANICFTRANRPTSSSSFARAEWRWRSTRPGRAPITFETLGDGEIVGVSWLIPPYRWTYDARAVELTRAIAMDAACLRGKCEADHDLGYEMMKRFLPVLVERLAGDQAADPRCLWPALTLGAPRHRRSDVCRKSIVSSA